MAMNPFSFNKKHLVWLVTMLLVFSACANLLYSQHIRTLYKPSGFNSWKPNHIFPRMDAFSGGLDSVVRTDFTIRMRDGVRIDCLKWTPVRQHPAGGFPTVIMHHGYGDNKETLSEFCRLQAQYGYYTMTFSVRGQGNSGGLSNLISTLEAEDLKEIVNWVRADTASGSAPDKILIMGGSQGGAVPMIAACTGGLNVAAIINSVAPPNFASSWMENGSIKMTLLWTIEYTPDTARYAPAVDRMSDWIYAETKQYWDSLYYHLPTGRDYSNILQNCTVPVLVEAAWQDKFFNADGWMLHIDKINSPMSSYLGAVRGHGADVSYTEDIWHMDWFNNWFYEWLWNIHTPILDQAKYQYASTKFPVVDNSYFTFVHDSSKVLLRNISTPLKLYFRKNKTLKTTAGSNGDYVQLKNTVYNNYTLQQAIDEEFKGSTFANRFKIDSVNFMTDRLTTDVQWTGTPVIRIDYKSTANTFCQMNYQLFEVLSTGERRFINRANFTDRNYTKGTRKQATFRGQSHSHIFKAGSRILVKITNFDRAHTDTTFFGSNPFVLPTMKNGSHTVYMNSNSYIQLPLVTTTGAPLSSIFEESESSVSNNSPFEFRLSQNFPNPFNPGTLIEYSIASNEKVELKVYDLLGREISVLVNEVQVPGSYSVMFNAVNLSSGIYFYSIKAGGFNEVKKMILVK